MSLVKWHKHIKNSRNQEKANEPVNGNATQAFHIINIESTYHLKMNDIYLFKFFFYNNNFIISIKSRNYIGMRDPQRYK